jgi:hypothetical protein
MNLGHYFQLAAAVYFAGFGAYALWRGEMPMTRPGPLSARQMEPLRGPAATRAAILCFAIAAVLVGLLFA